MSDAPGRCRHRCPEGHLRGQATPGCRRSGGRYAPRGSSVIVCLIAGDDDVASGAFYRIAVMPIPSNGSSRNSVMMVDRIVTIRLRNIGATIGRLDRATLDAVDSALLLILGLD